MTDFTSSLYLGLRHASDVLRPWAQLTTGVPSLLGEAPSARVAAARLAHLTGVETGVLARSTLHAFWDLMPLVARWAAPATLLLDGATYPVARWGVERAVCLGVPGRTFRHHDALHLEHHAKKLARYGRHPIVVADGFCPGCGKFAPIHHYLEVAQRFGGMLVLDDTQALGVAGPAGGGSVQRAGVVASPTILVSSLAKGFGAPLAFVGANGWIIDHFQRDGETRAHSSPPSIPDIHAALHALDLNVAEGNRRRHVLASLVARFRRGLNRLGLVADGGAFPVQTLKPVPGVSAAYLHHQLAVHGITTVLNRPSCSASVRVTFLLTAAHRPTQVDAVLATLASALPTDATSAGASDRW